MKVFHLLFNVVFICALVAVTSGQNKGTKGSDCQQEGGEVERKDDRFTGEATVTLKPQVITAVAPSQHLKMTLEYKIKPEGRGRAQSIIPEMVNVIFTSTAADRIYERDPELAFLIDGERVRRVPGATHDDYSRLSTEKVLKQTVFTGMSAETLRRISRAKTVEMKLGSTEVKLSPEILSAIRSFAKCAIAND